MEPRYGSIIRASDLESPQKKNPLKWDLATVASFARVTSSHRKKRSLKMGPRYGSIIRASDLESPRKKGPLKWDPLYRSMSLTTVAPPTFL